VWHPRKFQRRNLTKQIFYPDAVKRVLHLKKKFIMSNQAVTIPREEAQHAPCTSASRKQVLVFSPDADLARFLLLNLEDRFQIVREHRLENFEHVIKKILPDLILIDLYTFSADIVKQLNIVRQTASNIPIIALRAYMSLTPEMNKSIEDLTDILFYKPVDVELITQAIEDLLK
jgi:CheY-like chemotaxis protein